MKSKTLPEKGFTLVELLVSIAIFAVLSALGWKVFDYINKVKTQNVQHEQRLNQLQEAYQTIQRDMLQVIPIAVQQDSEQSQSFNLNNQLLVFNKAGVSDPLMQGKSPYERIEYRYNAQDKSFNRLKYESIHPQNALQPQSSVLLNDVDQFEIVVLNPDEMSQWPQSTMNSTATDANVQAAMLPKGIRIKLTIQDIQYEWIFSLINTDHMKSSPLEAGSQAPSSAPQGT